MNDDTIDILVEQNIVDVTVEPILVELNGNPIAIKGDKGDKGDDGIGIISEEYVISSPSSLWTINHNRGYYPNIVVLDIFNKIAIVEVEHLSLNQVRIYFSSDQVGKVIVN